LISTFPSTDFSHPPTAFLLPIPGRDVYFPPTANFNNYRHPLVMSTNTTLPKLLVQRNLYILVMQRFGNLKVGSVFGFLQPKNRGFGFQKNYLKKKMLVFHTAHSIVPPCCSENNKTISKHTDVVVATNTLLHNF